MGAALAEVDIPEFQPRQDVKIAVDDSADGKAAASNGVDDQRSIELLVKKLQVESPAFLQVSFWRHRASLKTEVSRLSSKLNHNIC